MEEQINNAIDWLKNQDVKGCITGSCLLGYFPDEKQDIDCFVYDEKSFNKLLFAMHHSPMFTILDKIEQWKFDQYNSKDQSTFYKFGLITLKFTYNTCIEVNVILKKKCTDIFSVLSSFDINLISKGYDIQTKQYLDLSGDSSTTKIADWNKWNTTFYSEEIWQMNRVLRQLDRCFKYHKRGYNTDKVVLKYIDIIEKVQDFDNIFQSDNFEEKLKITRKNTLIIKQLCETWLETHEINEDQLLILKEKIKEI